MGFELLSGLASSQDAADKLSHYRKRFIIPKRSGHECIYMTGNSLGLKSHDAEKSVIDMLQYWEKYAVEGHFSGEDPWMHIVDTFREGLATIVGAETNEVCVMNTLTVNLHLLLVSFYRPKKGRYKILTEWKPFPSDIYALKSQVHFHGYSVDDAIIEMQPEQGNYEIYTEAFLEAIEKHKDELCLILLGAINYYTGQFFDVEKIIKKAHEYGIIVGLDLAHAIGNVPLKLHDWGVDFAVWCTYKYLNGGPGSIAGAFVHEKHFQDKNIKRFSGWWGNDKHTRFDMLSDFDPEKGAEAWVLSNPSMLSMVPHRASVDMFCEVGMEAIRNKSILMTSYLYDLLQEVLSSMEKKAYQIITPKFPKDRGAQISILFFENNGEGFYQFLIKHGVLPDWRKPNVIRLSPAPLYNTYTECYRIACLFKEYFT